jgi:hypothetical protein
MAALLVAGLFAQWAVGLAIRFETEAERADSCRPTASWTTSSLPECRVSLPPEREIFLQASLFYQAAIVPAAHVSASALTRELLPVPPLRYTSVPRATLRRPPR